MQAHEIEDAEHRISIAVKNNKLLQVQRPDEFIKRDAAARPLRTAIYPIFSKVLEVFEGVDV